MTDAEVDALARNILKEVLAEVCKSNSKYFHEILEMQNGEQVPVFAGTSPDGLSSFNCQYMVLESIKTLIKEFEKIYDDFQQQVSDGVKQEITPSSLVRWGPNGFVSVIWGETLTETVQEIRDPFTETLEQIGFFEQEKQRVIDEALGTKPNDGAS